MTSGDRLHPSASDWIRTAVALASLAVMSSCAVGPEFERPEAPAVNGYTRQPLAANTASTDVAGGEAQRFALGQDISRQWWTLFQSPELNALIEKALKANPTLTAAEAALRQATELVRAQQGFFFPKIDGIYTAGMYRSSPATSPLLSTPNENYNLHTATVTVGFVPDVWGANRRQVESLRAQAASQRFLFEATYLTLTSNVVAAAVQEASLRAQIAATKDIIAISTKSLEVLRRQFEFGYVARLDVAAQEAALAQVQQTLPPLQKQLEQTRDLVTALAGRFPSDEPEETFELSELHLPQDLPVSLPSKLVEQRPDVRTAEEQLHAASAQIGVAIANMLPQFTIIGAHGGIGTDFTTMFAPGHPWSDLVAGITTPLFAGGTLLHLKRAAEAAFEQSAAQYRSTVLTAFQNVADTLYALQNDAESLKAALAAERAAKVTLDLTLKQQQVGYINYLALLSAQMAYQQALITRVQAQANRFADTAALFQALGGGWWNRSTEPIAQTVSRASERR
jgi:NodT family efflux transporter outer membrane factor (OMF) lipoprotein